MLTAFKTLMGIMCYCILSPPLLASAISQRSVCFCPSPSLSERISHPLLLQLLAASLLNSTIRSSPALSFILHFPSSPILHPTSLFLFHFLLGLLVPYPRWTSHSWSYSLATDHLLLPSYSSLTHWQRRRIRRELKLPTLNRWLNQQASVKGKEVSG